MDIAINSPSERFPLLERLGTRLFATSFQIERSAITFRLIATWPLALVIFASKDQLPYWELAVAAIVGMFAVNLWLRHANKTKLISSVRSALFGSVADTLLLLLVSNLAIRASADINSTSEMWLIFPLVILAFVYRAKPVAGIAYSVLLTAWYASHILAFFETGDRAIVELPIRATFFILMGSLAAVFGGSLRKQGSADH